MPDIELLGATYSDVPAVDLPKSGGGTVRFYDITVSDVTSLVTWDTNYVSSYSEMKVWKTGGVLIFSGKIVLKTGITIQGGFFATLNSSIAAKAGSVFTATYTSNDASSPEAIISIYMYSATQLRFMNNSTNASLTTPASGNVVRFSSVIPLN